MRDLIMDVHGRNQEQHLFRKGGFVVGGGGEGKKLEYRRRRSFVQGHGRGGRMSRYFTSNSLFLLVCLTVSLLILPLVLPPLPPPPLMLLLLPICILALLMILAFMPSNVRDATYAYV